MPKCRRAKKTSDLSPPKSVTNIRSILPPRDSNKQLNQMNHSDAQNRSSQRNGSIESSPLAKRSKACVSCRARKVKCDADVVGLPCSSCTSRQCPETCVLSLRKPRRRYIKSRPTVSIARSHTYMRCRKLDLATAKEKSGRSSVSLTVGKAASLLVGRGFDPSSRDVLSVILVV